MEHTTLDHLKLLTKLDSKSISERVLKLFEEGGELAKAVLPYENVSSTRHRFIEKNKILEEVIDTLLVSYSIAYHMDFTEDEIESMFRQKLLKWDNILSKEKRTAGKPVPYEIHITVDAKDQFDIDNFKQTCKDLSIKPIVLDLQTFDKQTVMNDVMTSSIHLGDNASAYNTAMDIVKSLQNKNFNVIRVKVETVPWHPAAPQKGGDIMPKDCYFESHVAVETSKDRESELVELAKAHNAHMSKNMFKVIDETNYVQMMTIRSYKGIYSNFDMKVDEFISELIENGFKIDKKIVEFSVYDTKVHHDSEWIS